MCNLTVSSVLFSCADDFFVGIGDINSTFLPKIDPMIAGPPLPLPGSSSTAASTSTSISNPSSNPTISTPIVQEEERERDAQEAKEMVAANSLILEAQLEERPLAKKQEELLDVVEESGKTDELSTKDEKDDELNGKPDEKPAERVAKKALLKNDDVELQRVNKVYWVLYILCFFTCIEDAYIRRYWTKCMRDFSAPIILDFRKTNQRSVDQGHLLEGPKRPSHTMSRSVRYLVYILHLVELRSSLQAIIPSMRAETLKDVHILFSSVIPLDTKPEATEIWRVANMFGAKCHTELSNEVTHVVAAKVCLGQLLQVHT